jgi:hypothetical protein
LEVEVGVDRMGEHRLQNLAVVMVHGGVPSGSKLESPSFCMRLRMFLNLIKREQSRLNSPAIFFTCHNGVLSR